MSKTKIIIISGIIILVAVVMGFIITSSRQDKQAESEDVSKIDETQNKGWMKQMFGENNQAQNCQNNTNPVFTSAFTDVSKLKYIAPIGAINAGSPGRSYVFLKESVTQEKVPIFAPVDVVLESMVYARRDPNNKNALGEYRLDFRVSCEVTLHFDHIDEVVEKIGELVPKTPTDSTRDVPVKKLPIKAGELLGYTDGATMGGSFDFFLINKSKQVSHINPKRWEWDQTRYADCPYDYFVSELKSQYYEMLRSQDGQKLANFNCGSPSHDVAGTASGGWFLGDSRDNKGDWLEVGNINGKVEFNARNANHNAYRIRDYQSKLFPEQVKIGDATCYSDSGNWAYIKLVSDTQLSVATGKGTCPEVFPQSQAQLWER